jgi:hypothetical protein
MSAHRNSRRRARFATGAPIIALIVVSMGMTMGIRG